MSVVGPGPAFDPNAVIGSSEQPQVAAVSGTNNAGGPGVSGAGVPGVLGSSTSGDGVLGTTTSTQHAGISAVNDSGGFGVWARGTPAGNFEGNVEIKGDLQCGDLRCLSAGVLGTVDVSILNVSTGAKVRSDLTVEGDILLTNADCSEEFDTLTLPDAEPGTVMVIGLDGRLKASDTAYDKRVVGVVSGAGEFRPAILLDKRPSSGPRVPIALVGKVACKVDAAFGVVEVGDLLTTSPTPGHAMRVEDGAAAIGSVIGKALRAHRVGRGLIPILIALN